MKDYFNLVSSLVLTEEESIPVRRWPMVDNRPLDHAATKAKQARYDMIEKDKLKREQQRRKIKTKKTEEEDSSSSSNSSNSSSNGGKGGDGKDVKPKGAAVKVDTSKFDLQASQALFQDPTDPNGGKVDDDGDGDDDQLKVFTQVDPLRRRIGEEGLRKGKEMAFEEKSRGKGRVFDEWLSMIYSGDKEEESTSQGGAATAVLADEGELVLEREVSLEMAKPPGDDGRDHDSGSETSDNDGDGEDHERLDEEEEGDDDDSLDDFLAAEEEVEGTAEDFFAIERGAFREHADLRVEIEGYLQALARGGKFPSTGKREVMKGEEVTQETIRTTALLACDMLERLFDTVVFVHDYQRSRADVIKTEYRPKLVNWKRMLGAARLTKNIPDRVVQRATKRLKKLYPDSEATLSNDEEEVREKKERERQARERRKEYFKDRRKKRSQATEGDEGGPKKRGRFLEVNENDEGDQDEKEDELQEEVEEPLTEPAEQRATIGGENGTVSCKEPSCPRKFITAKAMRNHFDKAHRAVFRCSSCLRATSRTKVDDLQRCRRCQKKARKKADKRQEKDRQRRGEPEEEEEEEEEEEGE